MPDEDAREALARLKAEADQALESSKELAAGIAAFYKKLVEEGLDSEEALSLTSSFLYAILSKSTEDEE